MSDQNPYPNQPDPYGAPDPYGSPTPGEQPAQPGYPGQQGFPGQQDFPGQPGYPDPQGQPPGYPEQPSYQGGPGMPGQPGQYAGQAGYPGDPNYPGQPGPPPGQGYPPPGAPGAPSMPPGGGKGGFPPQQPPKKKGNALPWILGCGGGGLVIVVVLILLGVFVIYPAVAGGGDGGDGGSAQSPGPGQSSQASGKKKYSSLPVKACKAVSQQTLEELVPHADEPNAYGNPQGSSRGSSCSWHSFDPSAGETPSSMTLGVDLTAYVGEDGVQYAKEYGLPSDKASLKRLPNLGDEAYIGKDSGTWNEVIVTYRVSNLVVEVTYGGYTYTSQGNQDIPHSKLRPKAINVAKQVAKKLG